MNVKVPLPVSTIRDLPSGTPFFFMDGLDEGMFVMTTGHPTVSKKICVRLSDGFLGTYDLHLHVLRVVVDVVHGGSTMNSSDVIPVDVEVHPATVEPSNDDS